MPETIPTPAGPLTVRTLADVLDAGIIDPHYRFNWEAAFVGAVWRESKGSGSAVIIHPTVCVDFMNDERTKPVPAHMTAEEWQRYKVDGQRKENDRRDVATLDVCARVLMGYVEGRYNYARKVAKGFDLNDDTLSLVETLIADGSAPSYTEMRGFLIGELDAHPVIAATAAFAAMRYCGRKRVASVYEAWTNTPPADEGRCWL